MRSRVRVIGAAVAVVLLVGLLAAASYFGWGGAATLQSQPVVSATAVRPAPSAPSRSPSRAASRDPASGLPLVELAALPQQAQQTVALIERGGPFPYAKDGAVFGNRERLLPTMRNGYYREYTVPTAGSADRGARRIVTGNQDRDFFYSVDHYASFVRVRR